jgi:radical SAM protein with 4Fe4S-binding SPASM domain
MIEFEGFPFIVGWELTLACNLSCEHCGSSAGLPRPDELTLEEALAICDQLPDLLVCEVDFTGGEPLARPDWWKIAQRLYDLNIKTKLITNGLLLTPTRVGQLKDAGVSQVGISIDGMHATHDQLRKRRGLFKRAVAGIELLRNAGIPVTVITTVTAHNVHELPSLANFFRSLGVSVWQFQPIFPLGRAQECRELTLSEQAYMQLGSFAEEYTVLDKNSDLIIEPGDSFGYYTELDKRQPTWGGCSAGLLLCGITSDGRIKGCLSMPDELTEGDLRQRDLWDIWFDSNSFSYNRNYTQADLGPNCRSCDLAKRCRGGCSSMSYACTGKLHNDPYCYYHIKNRSSNRARAIPKASGERAESLHQSTL